jgi:FKBP-type peptidyl-prolyl cis-trans isomerase FkpA
MNKLLYILLFTVFINYQGRFLNGNIFDSNASAHNPDTFIVGRDDVIKGWDLALQKLKKGDKVTLIIPSVLLMVKRIQQK